MNSIQSKSICEYRHLDPLIFLKTVSTYGDIVNYSWPSASPRIIKRILKNYSNPETVPCHRIVMSMAQ